MKRPLYIIKIGGSVLTDKSKVKNRFRRETVKRIIREIVEARRRKKFDLILVHGAGAYAHYLTTKYKISQNIPSKNASGFVHIKQELFNLNNLIWKECLGAGLDVCTVQPSAVIFTSNGKIKSFDTRFIEELLKLRIVPLLMGDDSIDERLGFSVLSGDQIVAYLGRKFRADKIIFVSDVEGVFDKNPKVYRGTKLMRVINKKNFKSVLASMQVYNKRDVSGEMKGKLLAIKQDLGGFKVNLIGGFTKGSVYKSLNRRSVGTQISL